MTCSLVTVAKYQSGVSMGTAHAERMDEDVINHGGVPRELTLPAIQLIDRSFILNLSENRLLIHHNNSASF